MREYKFIYISDVLRWAHIGRGNSSSGRKESSANNFYDMFGEFFSIHTAAASGASKNKIEFLKLILPYATTSTIANDDWGDLKEWHFFLYTICVCVCM